MVGQSEPASGKHSPTPSSGESPLGFLVVLGFAAFAFAAGWLAYTLAS